MIESVIVPLVCLAVIVILAALLYATSRGCLAGLGELRSALTQVAASIQTIERSLRRQRRVINDAHKQIRTVSKSYEKSPW